MIMWQKVWSALHGIAKEHGLDMNKPICPTWVWKLLWTSFENEVNKANVLGIKYSIASSKGHNARDDHIKTKTWERGSSFGNAQAQSFAKLSVLSQRSRNDARSNCAELNLSFPALSPICPSFVWMSVRCYQPTSRSMFVW